MKLQFYGTDGSVQKKPPQGKSVTHKLSDVRDLGDFVELLFKATNPQHLKSGDPEEKILQLPIHQYINMQASQTETYDVFRLITVKPGSAYSQQNQEKKFYVGLDIRA